MPTGAAGRSDAAEPAQAPAPAQDAPAAGDIELTRLARDAGADARALGNLALSEAALARINLVRLLLLALAVPAIVFGILLGVDALLAALVLRLLKDWTFAVASVLIINAALLGVTLLLLRRWWHSLSLPRSRAALARVVESLR
ncbi:MAG: hypothetical protein ABI846_08045 [Rudaea sp.]